MPSEEGKLVLDLGCGSGLSGEALEERGISWVGMDISSSMLGVALERLEDGGASLLHGDIGHGLPFRNNLFDGAISVSVLQWLCQSDNAAHNPWNRLMKLFESLLR